MIIDNHRFFRDQLHGKHDEVTVCGRKKDERSMGFNSGIQINKRVSQGMTFKKGNVSKQ